MGAGQQVRHRCSVCRSLANIADSVSGHEGFQGCELDLG